MESLPGISCAGILPHSVLVRRCVDVFIVEDFPAIRQRLHSALEAVPGVRVVGRADGADEATAAVARLEPQFVVLDLRLGQGSGLGVLEAVKRLAGAPVVAMVTSDPNDQYCARCAALGRSTSSTRPGTWTHSWACADSWSPPARRGNDHRARNARGERDT